MRGGIEIPDGVDVPEIGAEELEVVGGRAVAVRGEVGTMAPASADDVHSLLHFAIEKGADVGALERLVGLQERIMTRDARAAFIAAVAAFQQACPPLKKSKKVDYTNRDGQRVYYAYAPLPEIARTIRPLLPQFGLSYTWDSKLEGGNLSVTCTLRHIDGHSESSSFTCPTESKAGMSAAQKAGSALTYGRRQSLVQVLGMAEADDDPDGASGQPARASDEKISAEQAADLRSLMQEVKADERRFLAFASEACGIQIGRIEEIPASAYKDAVATLEQKRRRS